MGYEIDTEVQHANKEALLPLQNKELANDKKPITTVEEDGRNYKVNDFISAESISSKEIQRQNFINLLTYINNAGWLTSHIVSLLMYPETVTRIRSAERLLKKAEDVGYVTRHNLPEGKGSAFCVTDRGTSFLIGNNVDAMRAYRLRSENNFQLPDDWEHHIYACTALALLRNRKPKSEIIFERQIRRSFQMFKKIPDGILKLENKHGIWLEVERADKKPAERQKILDLITDAYYDELNLLNEITKYKVAIIFDPKQKNQKEHAINHRKNLTENFQENISCPEVEFFWGSLNFEKGHAVSIGIEWFGVFSKEVERIAREFHFMDWEERQSLSKLSGSYGLYYETWSAEFKRINDKNFEWYCGHDKLSRSGRVKDFELALKFIASTMIMMDLHFEKLKNELTIEDLIVEV